MTIRRLRHACALFIAVVVLVGGATDLFAASALQPIPGPCTAEGTCVPARSAWGFTPVTWRTWPGSETPSTRSIDEGPSLGDPGIPKRLKPAPEVEDQAAPEKVEALDPESNEGRAESDIELPDFPGPEEGSTEENLPPLRPKTPLPGFMKDAPANLPFGQPPETPAAAPAPADNLFPLHQNLPSGGPRLFGGDAPPPLPFAESTPASRRPSIRRPVRAALVQQASHTALAPGENRPTVEPLRHWGDAPPVLPALFESPVER